MTPSQIDRYARHIVLKEIGGPGQNKLLAAKIAIIGAGGLGGPAALYLAAAGIGQITLIDHDDIDLSNLQRQIQFSTSDIGSSKTQILANKLVAINPDCIVKAQNTYLDAGNAHELLSGHDLILDGTDNFATRFLVNQASLEQAVPLLSGAIGQFNGQIAFFNTDKDAPCYQCFVPDAPPNVQTCSQLGVVGALTGIIGSMMALEAIKHLTQTGQPLHNSLLLYDGLTATSRKIMLSKDPQCRICGRE